MTSLTSLGVQDTINEETVELMQPYITMEDYSMESAKRVSFWRRFLGADG